MKRLCASLVLFAAVTSWVATLSSAQEGTDRVKEARRQLNINSCDLQALAVLTSELRANMHTVANPQRSVSDLAQYSHQGLDCVNRVGDSGANGFITIFEGGAGFAALQRKDYDEARSYYRAALENDPSDLENVYQFAAANLSPKPPNSVEGLFFLARAVVLAKNDNSVQTAIEECALKTYRAYHGSDEGWDSVLNTAKQNTKPPAGFTIQQASLTP